VFPHTKNALLKTIPWQFYDRKDKNNLFSWSILRLNKEKKMAKKSRRNRNINNINKSSTVQNPRAQTLPQVNLNKPQTGVQPYESAKYLKNDLKWSVITAGIIAVILIIVYIFLH
jgi:hypothetical protein